MTTTSLKIPADLKQLAATAAKQRGVTPHAFMVEAIRIAATAAEQRAAFMAEALAAKAATLQSGKGFVAEEVHGYLRARAQGEAAAKPRAKSWRG